MPNGQRARSYKEDMEYRKEKQASLKEQKTLGIIESNYEVMLKNAGVEVPEAEKEMAGKAKEEVIS